MTPDFVWHAANGHTLTHTHTQITPMGVLYALAQHIFIIAFILLSCGGRVALIGVASG